MTVLTLVRHGETDWNGARRIQGSTDIPLNDTGREQARSAAAALRNELTGPTVVVASDLSRARETAEIIASELSLDAPLIYPDLRERAYGQAEGMLVSEYFERFGSWHGDEVPEAETREHLRLRGIRALRRIARDERRRSAPADTKIIAVSHGGLIRELIGHASGDTLPLEGEKIANGSRHSFLVERDALRLLTYAALPSA